MHPAQQIPQHVAQALHTPWHGTLQPAEMYLHCAHPTNPLHDPGCIAVWHPTPVQQVLVQREHPQPFTLQNTQSGLQLQPKGALGRCKLPV